MNPYTPPTGPPPIRLILPSRLDRVFDRWQQELKGIAVALGIGAVLVGVVLRLRTGSWPEIPKMTTFFLPFLTAYVSWMIRKNRQMLQEATAILKEPPVAVGPVERQLADAGWQRGILCASGTEIRFRPAKWRHGLTTLPVEKIARVSCNPQQGRLLITFRDGQQEIFSTGCAQEWQDELDRLVTI